MTEVIDLTASLQHEVIEISSDEDNISVGHHNRIRENKKQKGRKGKTTTLATDSDIGCSAWSSRIPSPESGGKQNDPDDSCTPQPRSASQALQSVSSSTIDEPGLFFFDGTAALIVVEGTSPPESAHPSGDDSKLLLPSHVMVFQDDGPISAEVVQPLKVSSDDEECIEYLDYEDRKAPGLVRYFEIEEEANQPRTSIFKCKNCGAEGDHKTYECPIQICLTCGAHDEHSTRCCPISKTCYACGMKGHINKTCPNRYSTYMASDHGDCGRCGSTEHNMIECPTLWRIYEYVNDEERIVIMQSREGKKQLAIGEGGEGYIGGEVWCYNCANTGHLGDDCDELPHSATSPTENSAFSSHNVMSGPFCDPATESDSVKRGPRERESKVDWPHLPDDWGADAPVDVGKRGKTKNKERLEKRYREQEDEGEDWFNDVRAAKWREMDRQAPRPHRKTLKFGLIREDGGHKPSSPPPSLLTKSSGPSLLARLSDPRGGRNGGKGDRGSRQREIPEDQSENSIRIRGAATDPKNHEGRYASLHKTHRGRYQDRRDDEAGDKRGHRVSRQDHGPRYRGSYSR